MKIVLAQQNYHIGHFEHNTEKIIAAITEAKKQEADLIVFSELSICGYPPRDFLEFKDFIQRCHDSVNKIALHADTIGVLLGCPSYNEVPEGKDLFNSAYLLYNQQIQDVVHKTLLPTYDVFDEYRYFEPAFQWHVMTFKGKKLAVTICEDIWNLGDNPLYRICPMDELIKQSPDIMINLSASPFDYTHVDDRKAIIKANVNKYKLPLLYCNAVGSQTEIVFDGGSFIFDQHANLIAEGKYFEEDLISVVIQDDGNIEMPIISNAADLPSQELNPLMYDHTLNIPLIHDAIVMGIKDYFAKMGFSKAILGSSGGIDSAVTLALACKALGAENVRAILLPSQFSTDHSVSDAEQLSKNLQNPYDTIPIKPIFDAFMTALQPIYQDLPFNVAEENIQARTRGNLLMAIANKFNLILLNTTNKSECATGYGTLYGDMAGGIAVLGDVYKMQVYALAKYINRDAEIIPQHIIDKAPSAELRPNQKDSDSLPDYRMLDAILYQYIERRQGPRDIINMGFEADIVNRTMKLVNMNEYKRNQFCPIIRVSPKAFGVGRRVPIVAKYLS
ncbi:MAG: NAD+ synthase [Bacteroidetes bacterium]|nr:NAD+ synthase [Bacteroidota bacterium]MBK9480722.1 NAD+ synthase [Bacteroidota bacterium]